MNENIDLNNDLDNFLYHIDIKNFYSGNFLEFNSLFSFNKYGFPDLSDNDEGEKITFVFHQMNYFFWKILESNSLKKIYDSSGVPVYYYDYVNYKKFILKYLLKEWSLEIPLERNETGELTTDCLNRVLNVHPIILDHFLFLFDKELELSENERVKISNQCGILFKANSPGLKDADSSIGLYCDLVSFWEKFGLNYFDIKKLPYDVFSKLKLIIGKENEIKIEELKHHDNKGRQINNKNGGQILGNYQF